MGFRVWGRGVWGFIPLRGLTFLPHHAKDVIECDSGFKVEDDSVHRYSLSFPVRNMLSSVECHEMVREPIARWKELKVDGSGVLWPEP